MEVPLKIDTVPTGGLLECQKVDLKLNSTRSYLKRVMTSSLKRDLFSRSSKTPLIKKMNKTFNQQTNYDLNCLPELKKSVTLSLRILRKEFRSNIIMLIKQESYLPLLATSFLLLRYQEMTITLTSTTLKVEGMAQR